MADGVTDHSSAQAGQITELDALVIGAGFAGLYQLLCLRDRLGLTVKAVEAAAWAVHGTGIAIPAHDAILKAMCIGIPSLPS